MARWSVITPGWEDWIAIRSLATEDQASGCQRSVSPGPEGLLFDNCHQKGRTCCEILASKVTCLLAGIALDEVALVRERGRAAPAIAGGTPALRRSKGAEKREQRRMLE